MESGANHCSLSLSQGRNLVMKKSVEKISILSGSLYAVAFVFSLTVLPAMSYAQLDNNPWGFTGQNRASIAALMKQVEDESSSRSNVVASGGGDIVNLVCGADATSSAKGNSSCIILNNSDAAIDLGQDSQGDQTATSEETTNVDETINTNVEAIDDVLQTLNGDT